MMPFSAGRAGPERDEHLDAPPLFFARTEGSTPFRFSLHVGDVGHTLVIGPTGAGKSLLLALVALQFRRYDRAQVFAFDFGGASVPPHWQWAATGTTSATPSPTTLPSPSRCNRSPISTTPASVPGRRNGSSIC